MFSLLSLLKSPLSPPFLSVCPSLPASVTSLPCFQHSKSTTNMEPSCLLLLVSTVPFPQLSAGLACSPGQSPQKCHLTREVCSPHLLRYLNALETFYGTCFPYAMSFYKISSFSVKSIISRITQNRKQLLTRVCFLIEK